ncbi:hypothetical protein ACFL4K_00960 [Candidatus Neomarinimicrobiota bacterium]
MKSHTKDHNGLHRKYASIVMLSLLFPISNLYSQEEDSTTFRIMVGAIRGVSEFRYDAINLALGKDYEEFPLGVLPENGLLAGLEGSAILRNRVVIGAALLFWPEHKLENEGYLWKRITFQRSTMLGKLGIISFESERILLYPYIGFARETMRANTELLKNFYVHPFRPTPEPFFGEQGVRAANDFSFLHGLEFIWLPKKNLGPGISVEIGSSIRLRENISNPLTYWFDSSGFYIRGHFYMVFSRHR